MDNTTETATLEDMLTTPELAKKLRLSEEQVARLRRRGHLPARKVGSVYRYFPSEIVAAMPSTASRLRGS
jgi:excisionase family DNA binding protein